MKTKLQEMVEALAIKHGFGLDWENHELALTVDEIAYHLVIEPLDPVLVRLSYRVTDEYGHITTPNELLFYTRDGTWVVVEIDTPEHSFSGATLETRQAEYYCSTVFDQDKARELADDWAEKLSVEGWLARGIVVPLSTEDAYRPSFSDLAAWMEEGGCEALDGCWVEPDGHCEHGSPSWLLHYGLI